MEKSVGGNKWLHLQTNKVVKHQNLTKMPITMSIIKQIHALTTLDDMPQGFYGDTPRSEERRVSP